MPLAALTVHQVDGDSPKWVMRRSSRSQKFARHSREAASSNLLTALARARLLFPSSTNCRQQLQPEDCLAPATDLHASAAMLILTFSHLLPSFAIVLLKHLLDSGSRPNTFELELWNRILKSLIKVRCPISDFPNLSDFLNSPCPCSCGHFKMRHTYVGPLVPEL